MRQQLDRAIYWCVYGLAHLPFMFREQKRQRLRYHAVMNPDPVKAARARAWLERDFGEPDTAKIPPNENTENPETL